MRTGVIESLGAASCLCNNALAQRELKSGGQWSRPGARLSGKGPRLEIWPANRSFASASVNEEVLTLVVSERFYTSIGHEEDGGQEER
jgi:hypothetical protein